MTDRPGMGPSGPAACDFWGKTPSSGDVQSFGYKPVIHHLLDVAAVALRLTESNPGRLARTGLVLGLPPARLPRLLAFLAGLHDLGKFSAAFQWKQAGLCLALGHEAYRGPADPGHWRLTAILLCSAPCARELHLLLPRTGEGRAALIAGIAGHHGRPTAGGEHGARADEAERNPCIGAEGLSAAVAAMGELRRVIKPEPLPELDELETCKAMSWPLAGLTSFADWIGSDASIFRFERPDMPLDDYWQLALGRADAAIVEKGLGRKAPARVPVLATIAPAIRAARPMQVAAESMPLPEGPALVVIEDQTGSGKTEAALVLAARMMAAGKAEGVYFALPTMATANAMYGRLGDIHRRLFADGARPNLVLAHGQAGWNEAFLSSIGRGTGPATSEGDVATVCNTWIADSRRKAFFADVGAGTVDQAFLGVLRKKWLALRQYGLAGKVLLVDEAHAFDAYMTRELEVLLQSHASAGGSTIVLSATLSMAQRQRLVTAFRRGLGQWRKVAVTSEEYPLITSVGAASVREDHVRPEESLGRDVAIVRVPDAHGAHALALESARRGAAVLLLRNAVDEAIASHEAIRAQYPRTQLFHARFAMADRQRIESEVLARFGRDAAGAERAGWILVATQVVEQSLDLDFDSVITDLAPVDLVIQRAGRLWRHMDVRPKAQRPVAGPLLHVVSPEPHDDVPADWLGPALGKGAHVYDHPGVMWRTARALFETGAIRVPEGLRPLIEAVYDPDGPVPAALLPGQNKAEGAHFGTESLANRNLIDVEDGYAVLGELSADEEIGTRFGEPTITARLARVEAERLVPWAHATGAGALPTPHAWAMSEVRVRVSWLGEVQPPPAEAELIALAKAAWPEWEANMPVLVVGADGMIAGVGSDGSFFRYGGAMGLTKRRGSQEASPR